MINADRFLSAWVDIEKHLKRKSSNGLYGKALLDDVRKKDKAVNSYYNDLSEFLELRNAIVHNFSPSHVIAEPIDWAADQIVRIRDLILDPPKIYPVFHQKVTGFLETDPISNPLGVINKQNYSQFPIFRGTKCVGLLTNNTISRWLGALLEDGIVSLTETKIVEVMKYTEDNKTYEVISRNATIFDAIDMFRSFQERGHTLEALLICDGAITPTSILGIMTVYDLPLAYKKIQIS